MNIKQQNDINILKQRLSSFNIYDNKEEFQAQLQYIPDNINILSLVISNDMKYIICNLITNDINDIVLLKFPITYQTLKNKKYIKTNDQIQQMMNINHQKGHESSIFFIIQ